MTHHVLTDSQYEALVDRGIETVIPPNSNCRLPAAFDWEVRKWHHLIENLFGNLKGYRGIATRYRKTDTSFAVHIAIRAVLIRTR